MTKEIAVVDERAAFESHYHLFDLSRDTLSGAYVRSDVRTLWDAWQARAAQPDHSAQIVPDAIKRVFITSESGGGKYCVVIKSASLPDMQQVHNWIVRHMLAADQAPGKQEGK